MSEWSLQRVWLSEVSGDCAPSLSAARSLDVVLDVDTLRVDRDPSGTATVTAELALSLSDSSGDGEDACDLAAAFCLTYRSNGGRDLTALATDQALRDVWPVFRVWALQTLALMEISAPGLPPALPAALIQVGAAALAAE